MFLLCLSVHIMGGTGQQVRPPPDLAPDSPPPPHQTSDWIGGPPHQTWDWVGDPPPQPEVNLEVATEVNWKWQRKWTGSNTGSEPRSGLEVKQEVKPEAGAWAVRLLRSRRRTVLLQIYDTETFTSPTKNVTHCHLLYNVFFQLRSKRRQVERSCWHAHCPSISRMYYIQEQNICHR